MIGVRSGEATGFGEVVRQYLELRDQHPGTILLFRVGSFYEVLFEDAELAARELGLKLGERPSGGSSPPVPQCGFAHHALDAFLPRLLARGYRVAICEESEDETTGGVRQRSVVRTLTPGTVTDPKLLREDRPNYLVAIVPDQDHVGLAWTDVAAGEFKVGEFSLEDAAAELQRLDPVEILVPADRSVPEHLIDRRNVTRLGPRNGAGDLLRETFPAAELDDVPLARTAGGLVLGYLSATRGSTGVDGEMALEPPQPTSADECVRLDAATQRHLELVETERSREREGSLLGVLDRTVTPMGRRMLRSWLLRPLTDVAKLSVRQRIVAELVGNERLRMALTAQLRAVADVERLAGRVAAARASVDDLRMVAGFAGQLQSLAVVGAMSRSSFIRGLGKERPALTAFSRRAAQVLADPGNEHAVRPDGSAGLRQALTDLEQARAWQSHYVEELRRQPGLGKVRLERNNTQGIFLEVPVNTAVPLGWIRRGGLQKVERFTTPELDAQAAALAEAEAQVSAETNRLLTDLRAAAVHAAPELRDLSRHLAAADALVSLVIVAAERGWTQPIVDTGETIEVRQGRHPVIDASVPFQPNDARLIARADHDQVVVLTGPNMAGKSTWMRQVALITLLAQMGSFVPAASARIGIADAIFTRIGAVDDLAGGQSTFMVEMLETVSVMRGATDRSLVILDEIGRGTSTHDGMAIAWSIVEHLANGPVRPRSIVATHYHELAALHEVHPQVTLLRAAVDERSDGVVFTHRIEPGAADRSFGIEVARLAGLPEPLLARARAVADAIEPLSAEIACRLGTVGSANRESAQTLPEGTAETGAG